MHIKEFLLYCSGVNVPYNLKFYKCFILVYKNWFEGIIVENILDSNVDNIGIVYGVYVNNYIIDMFSCCDNKTIRYCMENCIGSYIGTFSTLNVFPSYNGNCFVKELDSKIYTSNEITNKFNIYKSLLNFDNKLFYNYILKNKDKLLVLTNYYNQPFEKINNIVEDNLNFFNCEKKYQKKYDNLNYKKKNHDWYV